MGKRVMYKDYSDGFCLFGCIADAPYDGEATKAKILPLITEEMDDKKIEKLFEENKVYCNLGPEAEYVDEEQEKTMLLKAEAAGEYRLLCASGDYVPNYKGSEYWMKMPEGWVKEKIEEIGLEIPEQAVLQSDLTSEQQEEIANEAEKTRISKLTDEKKSEEINMRIEAVAAEAVRKSQIAELTGEEFNKHAWFQERKSEIEAMYAA